MARTPAAGALSADDASLKTAGLHVDNTASVATATANFVTGPNGTAPSGSGPAQTALNNAAADGADWLTANRDYAGTRYSPLTQINAANAAHLRKSCSYDMAATRHCRPALWRTAACCILRPAHPHSRLTVRIANCTGGTIGPYPPLTLGSSRGAWR